MLRDSMREREELQGQALKIEGLYFAVPGRIWHDIH